MKKLPMAKSFTPKTSKPMMAVSSPSFDTEGDQPMDINHYKVRDSLNTLTQADGIRKDRSMMKLVKGLVKAHAKTVGPKR